MTNKRDSRYRAAQQKFKRYAATANLPCNICGHPIDYAIPHNDEYGSVNNEAFELDHLYPVATHKELELDPANFRATHAGCNRAKGNNRQTPKTNPNTRAWVR